MIQRNGNLIVISGPSGVGKSTLVKRARQALPDLAFSVSCTTRAPRAGEQEGREYYFLREEEFLRKVEAGDFLEHAGIFAHRYGTLKSEVIQKIRAGQEVLLDIDVQGARQIHAVAEKDPLFAASVQFIMIVPPDMPTLEARLRGRQSENEEQLAMRLAGAKKELSHFRIYDYLVVNDELDRASEELVALLRSLRLRTATIQGEPFV